MTAARLFSRVRRPGPVTVSQASKEVTGDLPHTCEAPCWMCATVWPEPKTAREMVAFYEQRWLRLVRVGEGIYLFGSGNLW